MNTIKPIVGKQLLSMLMLQLYSNPRCIYREYIQNALDSITEAVQQKVLKRPEDGIVSITIGKNDITILDNGMGIKETDAPKVLMDIANSLKDGVNTAGQFGVGRLSGGGYCEQLEFTTSYVNEAIETTIRMDIKKLKTILNDPTYSSAEQTMENICTISKNDVTLDKHYFKVILHNITNSADVLLNKEDILSYIRQTAPIGYSTTFQTLIKGCPQPDLAKKLDSVEKIKVSVNEVSDVEKGYGLKIIGTEDEIHRLRYFELPSHPKFGKLAWGWYAVTPFTKQIDDQIDENVGIRLRKHNISLDRNFLDSLFKEPRGNKYFYGEIFIINKEIEPDSGRSGLAASEAADALKAELKKFFNDVLYQIYYKANKYKTSLRKIKESVESVNNTDNSTTMLVRQLKENVERFQKETGKVKLEEVNDVISIYREKYKKELASDVNKLLDSNGNQTGLVISPLFDSPSYIKSSITPSISVASQSDCNEKNSSSQSPAVISQPTQNDITTQKIVKQLSPVNKKSGDPFDALTAYYSQDAIKLLRNIYKYMQQIIKSKNKQHELTKHIEWAINAVITDEKK